MRASDIQRIARNRLSESLALAGSREHERDLYLIYTTQSLKIGRPASTPTITKVTPRPKIKEKTLDAVLLNVDSGVEGVSLQRFDITAISRAYTEQQLTTPAYYLVLDETMEVTPEFIAAGNFTRYKIDGNPNRLTNQWTMTLCEDSS